METESPIEFWQIEAELRVGPMLSFEDVAPTATDLNQRLFRVRTGREALGPSMAAGPDLAVTLLLAASALAAAEPLRTFVRLLTEDAYKALRAGLLRLVGKANEQDDSRTWNIGITIGSQNFFFRSPMDDEEFVRRLVAMGEILVSSPDSLLDGSRKAPHEPNPGWSWDIEKGLWVPTPGVEEAMRSKD